VVAQAGEGGRMKTLGVIANTDKPQAPAVLRQLAELAHKLGLMLVACGKTAEMLPGARVQPGEMAFDAVDAVLVLGGDGTMLAAVRRLQGLDKPLIGVNIGSLGFMTSVSEAALERALCCLCDGTYRVSERSVAECCVHGQAVGESRFFALNEVVVSSGASSRAIKLEVCAGESLVTTYVCDGLIVSTPTGSTGHSLSAGGPILLPDSKVFVVSVICPHTLSSRPLVVPDTTVIRIRGVDSVHGQRLSVDGQVGRALCDDDVVEIRRSERNVRFLHLPDYDYFGVLRQKLGWSGSAGWHR